MLTFYGVGEGSSSSSSSSTPSPTSSEDNDISGGYEACHCGHRRECQCGGICPSGPHCDEHGHPYEATYIIYEEQWIAYNILTHERVPLDDVLNQGVRSSTHNHSHSRHGGQDHGSNRSTFSQLFQQIRNSRHDNAHGHDQGPSRRNTQTRPGSQGSHSGNHELVRGLTNQSPHQPRQTIESSPMDLEALEEQLTRLRAAIAAIARNQNIQETRQPPPPLPPPQQEQERDYALEDLRDRYHSDGSERTDPELDLNSNGSPPPQYEP
ncbi:hypothetical protein F4821DRAFT_277849 [Hypoxylon rubiginosum]|uniref:Uncharacterized protein n=1 Tax=Hypoxylon rubiginosum TaxID=110542 RepID=A0ACC0D4C8_9PEZI|nr:hypothetical protein F4821DRAFT_277849 [Hypoxylon rubiginosum]